VSVPITEKPSGTDENGVPTRSGPGRRGPDVVRPRARAVRPGAGSRN